MVRWKGYFQTILDSDSKVPGNTTNETEQPPFNDDRSTTEEVEGALHKLEAAEHHRLTAEIVKQLRKHSIYYKTNNGKE